MKTFVVAQIFVYITLVANAPSDEELWQDFKVKHNKRYKNILQDTTRFKTFQENLRKIEQHNEKFDQGLVTYKLGITKFADMTLKAFRNRLNSLEDSTSNEIVVTFPPSADEELADEIDWRAKGAVTRIKDQRNCISSWAFSTTASLESHYFLRTEELVTLSEQYLIDCNTKTNYGCGGGRVIQAYLYIRDYGTVLEESYPYKGKDGACKANGTLLENVAFAAVTNDENELKKTVGLIGPAATSIDASDLNLYAGGVYHNTNCSKDVTNHQVVVVGYGTTSDGIDYWLIKNSWGTNWGEDGYLRLIRNTDSHCGVTNNAIYPILFDDRPPAFGEPPREEL